MAAMATAVKIILDTDMSGDADDAGALAVVHKLADFGECELLACVVNGRDADKACAATIAAINTYYGRPAIPIGTYQGPKVQPTKSGYTAGVREEFPDSGRLDNEMPRALDVYRAALAAAPDGGVTIVSIGFLMNLRDLLESPPDAVSPLGGVELARQKVDRIVVMGGQFPASDPKNGEYNFAAFQAGPDTQFVVENWPTPILFTGFEIGEKIVTGTTLPRTPAANPVRRAYELYNKCEGRASWDQSAVLAAVRPPERYWNLSGEGRCVVAIDGTNTWSDERRGHEYLVPRAANADLAAVIDDLMTLPPRESQQSRL
jgi:inosine-uridine nucleoside N-ribohydrolase